MCRIKEQKAAVLRRLARRSLRESVNPTQGPDLRRISKGGHAAQVQLETSLCRARPQFILRQLFEVDRLLDVGIHFEKLWPGRGLGAEALQPIVIRCPASLMNLWPKDLQIPRDQIGVN